MLEGPKEVTGVAKVTFDAWATKYYTRPRDGALAVTDERAEEAAGGRTRERPCPCPAADSPWPAADGARGVQDHNQLQQRPLSRQDAGTGGKYGPR